MRRNVTAAIAATAVVAAGAGVALAAGDSDDNGSAGSSSVSESTVAGTGDTTATAGAMTISILQVEGLGDVLADQEGRVLYTSEVETEQEEVLCTDDACTSFWEPLEADSDTPTGPEGVGELGVVERPDGTQQVTLEGIPLYTFTEDEPEQATGEGLSDEFGGETFTWHVALAESSTSSTPDTTDTTSNTTADTSTDTADGGGGVPNDDDLGY
jgi:predicted lipoprotein with Yx(FWY)xxD motif